MKLALSARGERRAGLREREREDTCRRKLEQSNLRGAMRAELAAQSDLRRAIAQATLRKTVLRKQFRRHSQLAKNFLRAEVAH